MIQKSDQEMFCFQNHNGYKFGYTVRADETGDYKTHHEVSDGNGVKGSYSVGEPNGDLRVVTYTADRVNGFRALVKVHPGGSPIKPVGGPTQRSEPTLSESNNSRVTTVINEHIELTTSAAENKSTIASSTSLDLDEKRNHTEVQNNPLISAQAMKNKNRVNYKPNIKNDESVTLFKILPALDKHVPKVEYIVEEVLGDDKEETIHKQNSKLRNGEDELFEGSQIIPVKILQDPTDQSPEMVGLDANLDTGYATTIPNEDVIMTNYQEINKETQISDVQNTTLKNLMTKEPTTLAPQSNDISSSNRDEVTKELVTFGTQKVDTLTTLQTEVFDTTKLKIKISTNDSVKNKTVQNKSEFTSVETQTPTIKQTQHHDSKSTTVTMKNTEPVATQPTINLTNEEVKHTETEIPNNIVLAALMFPSVPILKFTCLPDTTDQVDVKTTPTAPSHISKLTNATPPQRIPQSPINSFTSTVIPLYPFQLLNFKPQKSSEASPQKGFKMSPQPPLPVYSDFTTIPSTPFVNLRTLSQKPSTEFPTPQQNLDTPKPTQGFLRNVDYTHQKSMANRHHYPLYPIPPPWTYHPARPLHNHPRHLPIFVLPMSHNFNFAPTFNPEAFEGHNH